MSCHICDMVLTSQLEQHVVYWPQRQPFVLCDVCQNQVSEFIQQKKDEESVAKAIMQAFVQMQEEEEQKKRESRLRHPYLPISEYEMTANEPVHNNHTTTTLSPIPFQDFTSDDTTTTTMDDHFLAS